MTMSAHHLITDDAGAPVLPVLLFPEGLAVQYRRWSEGGEFALPVRDTVCLRNTTQRPTAWSLLPGPWPTLLFPSHASAQLYAATTTCRTLILGPGQALYVVRLRGGGRWLTEQSLHTLIDRPVELAPFMPGCEQLTAALLRGAPLAELSALLQRRLELLGGGQSAPVLRRCLELIDERHGQIRVAELSGELDCGERYLNRLLRREMGLSPKAVCQLVQLHHALHTLLTTRSRSLLHIAVGCGYFDQAHMNRHFYRFLGCSANQVRRGALGGDGANDQLSG